MLSAGAMLLPNAAGYSPSASPSQLVILGMHHSGTSLLANLTMMMGAHGGEKDELLLHPDNPLKYWERRDVVALDEARLAAGLNEAVSQRYDMPSWVAYGFDAEKAAAPVHGSAEAKAIVSKLNEKRPWVTKDPRMSLVASEWMQLLDAPACVIMHREPLSVANSMMIYSHNVSLAEWSSVYEAYYASVVAACDGCNGVQPRLIHGDRWPEQLLCVRCWHIPGRHRNDGLQNVHRRQLLHSGLRCASAVPRRHRRHL